MPDALQCIVSLVKNPNKFDNMGGLCTKNTQKQPKFVLSTLMKTF